MSESSKRRRLFEAVMSHPASERRAVLERLCAGTPDLVQQVWAMVVASERSAAALGDPVAIVARAAESASRSAASGDQVGRYRLVEPIGEGGFGEVWTAQQSGGLERLVAVKILKPGMDSRQVVARFEQERQALALMEHPHIARVFDAGTTADGRPFFAMELVKGLPVTDYCTVNGLDLEARLEVFSQVCHAVQHAHAKGIIHRDIKPSNVLVETHDGRPCAKVIDFGIAKAIGQALTDKSIFTAHAAMVGTLEYMSPEQADGALDIDIRSDVYSLGALLYELLTGEPPVTAGELQALGLAGLLEALREREPERPSVRISKQGTAAWRQGAAPGAATRRSDAALAGILARDLDWVVMKALEKDRGRRYPTADALAEDLRRYRDGEALVAVPPSVTYRLRKFVRRRRMAVTVGSVAVGIAAIGIVIAGVQRANARLERARSEQFQVESRWREYSQQLSSSLAAAGAGEPRLAQETLARAEEPLRGWEWDLAQAIVAEAPRGLDVQGEYCVLVQDGRFLVSVSHEAVHCHDVASGELRDRIELPCVGLVAKDEHGATDAVPPRPGYRAEVLSILGGSKLVVHVMHDHGVGSSALLALQVNVEGVMHVDWSLPSGSLAPLVLDTVGSLLLVQYATGHMSCLRAHDGYREWTAEVAKGLVLDAAISADGSRMIALTNKGTSHLVDLRAGAVLAELELPRIDHDAGWSDADGWHHARIGFVDGTDLAMVLVEDCGQMNDWAHGVFIDTEAGLAVVPGCETLVTPIARWVMPFRDDYLKYYGLTLSAIGLGEMKAFGGMTRQFVEMFEDAPVIRAINHGGCGSDAQHSRLIHPGQAVVKFSSSGIDSKQLEADLEAGLEVTIDLLEPETTGTALSRPYAIWAPPNRAEVFSLEGGDFLGLNPHIYRGVDLPQTAGPVKLGVPRIDAWGPSAFDRTVALRNGPVVVWSSRPPEYAPGSPFATCLALALRPVDAEVVSAYDDCWVTFDPYTGVRRIEDPLTPIPRRAVGSVGGRHLCVSTDDGLRLVGVDPEIARPLDAVEGDVLALAVADRGPRAAAVVLPRDRGASLVEWGADGSVVARRPIPADELLEDSVLVFVESRVALGTRGGRVLIWNGASPEPAQVIGWPEVAVHALAPSRSGGFLAVGLSDGSVVTLDATSGKELRRFNVHIGPVRALAWSATDTRLFSAGEDRFVRVLEPSSGRMVLDLGNAAIPGEPTRRYYDGRATCLLATPDGERLIAGFDDGAIRVWDAVPWKQRYAELQARKR
jgi:serine/threonine protein kinase